MLVGSDMLDSCSRCFVSIFERFFSSDVFLVKKVNGRLLFWLFFGLLFSFEHF
jgi:hypothetical protein